MNTQALTKSAIVSTILQVIMVLVNHYAPSLAGPMLAPVGGTAATFKAKASNKLCPAMT